MRVPYREVALIGCSLFARALLPGICSATPRPTEADLPAHAVMRLGELRPLRHTAAVHELAFSPDSRTLVTVGADLRVRAWDVASGRARYSFPAQRAADRLIAFGPAGNLLVYGHGTDLELHAADTGALTRTISLPQSRGLSQLVRVGDQLVWSSKEWSLGTVDLAADKTSILSLPQTEVYECLAGSPRGDLLAYCQRDVVHLLDVREPLKSLPFAVKGRLAVFAPRGDQLAIGASGGVTLVDLKDGQQRELRPSYTASSLAYAPDGQTLAVGGQDGHLRVYDTVSGQLVRNLSLGEDSSHASISLLSYAPGGEVLAAVENGNVSVTLLDPQSGQRRFDDGHRSSIGYAAFSADGQRLVSTSWDGRAILWALNAEGQGAAARRIDTQPASRISLAATLRAGADSLVVATEPPHSEASERETCPYGPYQVRRLKQGVFELLDPHGKTLTRWTFGASQRPQLVWSPGCQFVVSLDSRFGRIEIVRTRDGQRRSREFGDYVYMRAAVPLTEQVLALRRSPQEPMFDSVKGIVVSGTQVHVIDLKTAGERSSFAVPGLLGAVACAPDGRSLAVTVGRDIQIHDTRDGALLQTYSGHDDEATALAYSPDGRRLVSGSRDTTLLLWQLGSPGTGTGP